MAGTDEEAGDSQGLLPPSQQSPQDVGVSTSARGLLVAGSSWVLNPCLGRRPRAALGAGAVLGACALAALLLQRSATLTAVTPGGPTAAGEELVALREAHHGDHEKSLLSESSPVDKGWKIIVESQTGHQRECTIFKRDDRKKRLRVHYDGFPAAYDEWLPIDSTRILEVLPTTTSTSTTITTTTVTTTSITRTSTTATTTTVTTTTTIRKYVSLFCFTMTRADEGNSELQLVRLQLAKRFGIFDCDQQIVFSDRETWLSAGPTLLKNHKNPIMISTFAVPADLSDAKEDPRKAAWLNAGDFVKCWQQVVLDGRYRWNDYVVKVDPDTVFVPARLRDRLKDGFSTDNEAIYLKTCKTTPRKCYNLVKVKREYGADTTIKVVGASTDTYSVASTCDMSTKTGKDCLAGGWGNGVHMIVNQNGKVIGEGNCCHEHNEVTSVDHDCAQQQFDSKDPGLSGALEIVSKAAVDLYSQNGHRCKADSYLDMGEEFFMQECFKLLGCAGMPGESLLQDDFCGAVPGDCRGPQVAFHPFKTLDEHIKCMGNVFMDLVTAEMHSDLLRVAKADG